MMEVVTTIPYLLQIEFLAKVFIIVLVFFYFIFTLISYRQISLMAQSLNSSIAAVIRLVALLQIFAVVFLFFLSFVLL